jgi:heme/copper-type cytochrome/quinol oxidase subunit 4
MIPPITTIQSQPSKPGVLTRLRGQQLASLFGLIAMILAAYSCFRRSDWMLFSAAVALGVFQMVYFLVLRRRSNADSKTKSA